MCDSAEQWWVLRQAFYLSFSQESVGGQQGMGWQRFQRSLDQLGLTY